jgi:hypothetical protein
MLRSLKSLKQSRIQTSNGTIGSIADYLFDDARWSIRYLIVNTGGWLSRKEVLISPLVIEQVEASLQDIRLSVTKEKVENSPDVDSHLPVSRQKEKQHHDYYQWPYYWAGTGIGGMATYPTVMLDRARLLQTPPREFPKDLSDDNGDPHLRSAKVVEGYEISATDNLFGSVDDFIIDDELDDPLSCNQYGQILVRKIRTHFPRMGQFHQLVRRSNQRRSHQRTN